MLPKTWLQRLGFRICELLWQNAKLQKICLLVIVTADMLKVAHTSNNGHVTQSSQNRQIISGSMWHSKSQSLQPVLCSTSLQAKRKADKTKWKKLQTSGSHTTTHEDGSGFLDVKACGCKLHLLSHKSSLTALTDTLPDLLVYRSCKAGRITKKTIN